MTAIRPRNTYNLSPRQIVALWLDFEAQGMDWKRVGPKDLSNCAADFKEKLEQTVWCCRVADDAFTRIRAGRDFTILRSYLLHTIHFGRTPDSFWLIEAGGELEKAVERYLRCVESSAHAIKRAVEVEVE